MIVGVFRGIISTMILPLNPTFESAAINVLKADFQVLLQQVDGLKDALDLREQKITTQQAEIERLNTRIQWFEQQYKLDQARRFGTSSGKAHSLQRGLFNEAEMIVDQTGDDQ